MKYKNLNILKCSLFGFLICSELSCTLSNTDKQNPQNIISNCVSTITSSFFFNEQEFKNSLSNCISSIATMQLKISQADVQTFSNCIADVIVSSSLETTHQKDRLNECVIKAGQKLSNVNENDLKNFLILMETIARIYNLFN